MSGLFTGFIFTRIDKSRTFKSRVGKRNETVEELCDKTNLQKIAKSNYI